MNKENIVFSIFIVFIIFTAFFYAVGIYKGYILKENEIKEWAIKYDYAKYHSKTGKFIVLDKKIKELLNENLDK